MTNTTSRRAFLKLASVVGFFSTIPQNQRVAYSTSMGNREWVMTGIDIPELASFDNTMQDFMQTRNISGGSLAVTRNSKLVFARGYSYSDDNEDITVQPTSLFRIASISKPITATAILRLVQDTQLDLSEKLTDILTLIPPSGQSSDSRLTDVTVLNLLQHLGGWDRGITFDPMLRDFVISNVLNVSLPISKENIISYMTGQPLQHDPGTIYAYSNYGYSLLGRIIETVTGQPYQNYVLKNILSPINISGMILGGTQPKFRLTNEVKYHTQYNGITVFDNSGTYVSRPYGGFNLENMDSHGGWLASAIDLVRFASTFDESSSSPVLNSVYTDTMYGLPENISSNEYTLGDAYYACGWSVRDWGNGSRNTWHNGGLGGTSTLLVRRRDGLNWCVLFNQRDDSSGLSYGLIDGMLHNAANAVSSWPTHDLFEEYLTREKVFLPLIMQE